MIMIGRAEDRFRWRKVTIIQTDASLQFPIPAAFRFLVICMTLIALTLIFVNSANVSAAIGLMLAAPIVMASWVVAQNRHTSLAVTLSRTRTTLGEILLGSATELGRSVFILGMAGFIGEGAARLAPVQLLADQLAVLQIKTG